MNYKLKNKKGFTLTELIVVIVIIGILAAVLIPTLTGYINKAKESAAKQEADPFITAYTAWEIEYSDEILTLDGFREYCVELELVESEEASSIILSLDAGQKAFIVKASNGLYVKCSLKDNQKSYTIMKELPVDEMADKFFEIVIKENLAYVNESLNGIAKLVDGGKNADGSVNIKVQIIDGEKTAKDVVGSVIDVIEIIESNGGKKATACPNIDEISIEEFMAIFPEEDLTDGVYYVPLNSGDSYQLGLLMSCALAYDKVKVENDSEFLLNETKKILGVELAEGESAYKLEDLINMNPIKVIATIQADESDESSLFDVVYNFEFVNYTE